MSSGIAATIYGSVEQEPDVDEKEKPSCQQRWVDFFWEQELLILMALGILLARAYPKLGAVYVQPDITATWIGVVFIFIMAGLSLRTEEFKKAFLNAHFNIFVNVFNFGFVSMLVFGVSRALVNLNFLHKELADGMVVCSCLPMAVNMVIVLTKSAGGDEAAAVFNSAVSNLLGVFLSPVLILGYLGVTGNVNLIDVFYKLVLRVVLPVIVGQILREFDVVNDLVNRYKDYFKHWQQYCLVFIAYTVFSRTFFDGTDGTLVDVFVMIFFQFLLISTVMVLAWYLLENLFPDQPKLRVMGLYGCTQKTVAVGVPLITVLYKDDPAVGLYTLPLLIWQPLQLIIGSMLAPRLTAFIKREQERLGIDNEGTPLLM